MFACDAAILRPKARPEVTNSQEGNRTVPRNGGAAVDQNLEGIYFGTSENRLGHRAWLLRLNSVTGEGTLYMPPDNLKLLEVKLSSTGKLTFRSDATLGEMIYLFDGQVTSNGIRGTFHFTQNQSPINKKTGSAEVVLQKLETQSLSKERAEGISGLYSNVKYNEEGGDLVGEDLIFIPLKKGLAAILVSYENEMLPYAAVSILRSGNEIRFEIHTEAGVETYVGSVSTEKIVLRRSDSDAVSEAESIILFKKKEWFGILTKDSDQ
jgi:hypothetical protein